MLKNITLLMIAVVVMAVVLPSRSLAATSLAANIVAPASGATIDVGQAVTFSGNATGGEAPYAFVWNFGDGSQGGGQNFTKTFNTAGARTVTLTVTDFANRHAAAGITLNVQNPVQTLSASISAPSNGASFNVGQAVTFSGNATGGSAPYAFVWNFDNNFQGGGQNFTKIFTATGSRRVTLTVTDFANRHAAADVSIIVNQIPPPPPPPTVDLKINSSNGPVTIANNTAATLSWASTNAAACTATGSWSGSKTLAGSESTGNLVTGTYVYTLTCAGSGGSANDSVAVNVSSVPPPPPPTATVSLKANGTNNFLVLPPGTNLTLSWTTINATACAASASPASAVWTGNKDTSGSMSITPAPTTPGDYVYTLTCNSIGNSVTVTVPPTNPDQLVITNIRVTDIVQTSAIIRWTTNKPANSRVIYDTTSHPDISSQSEPNFGYANSSATLDESTLVTEHAVTLTGLTANTQYYFRVLSR